MTRLRAGWIWRPAAVLAALLWVFAANGGPLVYFDSLGYLAQGHTLMRVLLPEPAAPPEAGAGTEGQDRDTAGAAAVNLSRSVVYPAVLGLFDRLRALAAYVPVAALWVLLTTWLAVRPLRRQFAPADTDPPLVALPLIVAGAGALPFYVAYVMPDIFAPTLILAAATLTVFGRGMYGWEIALAALIMIAAILMHPSHLLIAIGLVPVALVLGLVTGLRRWWVGPLVLALAAGVGVAERILVPVAATKIAKVEVIYYPILTARAIVDGPGWDYLVRRCPDEAIPTCALYAELSRPGDPYRMTESHIAFETSEQLGSYQLLDPETRRRIGQSQTAFFLDVVRADPLGMAWALLGHTLEQARANSIEMTIASPEVVERARDAGLVGTSRLTAGRGWIPAVEIAQTALYLVALVTVLVLLFWPRMPVALRALAIFVLLGILDNAFVCGGVSQPANRYGGRVIWLLPWLATLLALVVAVRSQEAGVQATGRGGRSDLRSS